MDDLIELAQNFVDMLDTGETTSPQPFQPRTLKPFASGQRSTWIDFNPCVVVSEGMPPGKVMFLDRPTKVLMQRRFRLGPITITRDPRDPAKFLTTSELIEVK